MGKWTAISMAVYTMQLCFMIILLLEYRHVKIDIAVSKLQDKNDPLDSKIVEVCKLDNRLPYVKELLKQTVNFSSLLAPLLCAAAHVSTVKRSCGWLAKVNTCTGKNQTF